jgi:hypothetical protein
MLPVRTYFSQHISNTAAQVKLARIFQVAEYHAEQNLGQFLQ